MSATDIDDAVLEASRLYRATMIRTDRKIRSQQKGEAFYGKVYGRDGRPVLVSVPVEDR